MNQIINLILFACIGITSLILSILAVSSKNVLRSVTYLFFVLICTSGFFLFLNYHFLAAVQISIYAGGVVILFIFSIFLTKNPNDNIVVKQQDIRKYIAGIVSVVIGVFITIITICKSQFFYKTNHTIENDIEINMKIIGQALIGTAKYQYLLPFEVVSLLLLSCIIGGIVISRKKNS